MELHDIVTRSEKDIEINDSTWFYHAFYPNEKDITDMLTDGIKAPILLGKKKSNGGNNGLFYVSVCKRLKTRPDYRHAYSMFRDSPMFIIEGINPIKCNISLLSSICMNTPLPFRNTSYEDEYQQFLKISCTNIIGIQLKLLRLVGYDNIEALKMARELISVITSINSDLPIYDYSLENAGLIKEIDKELFLSLTKHY